MRLNWRNKARFFDELARLVKAGLGMGKALETMARGNGAISKAAASLASRGGGYEEAMRARPDIFNELDCGVVLAAERSGRLEDGLRQLHAYYARLASAKSSIIKRLLYPVTVLHLGIILLALPKLVAAGAQAFGDQVLFQFGIVYGAGLLLAGLWLLGARMFQRMPGPSRVIARFGVLPLESLALARFFLAFGMQMRAGVGVIAPLKLAASASSYAALSAAAPDMERNIRDGVPLADALSLTGVFNEDDLREMRVAEATGGLAESLTRTGEERLESGLARISALGVLLPRVVYLAILLFLAWQIVSTALGIRSAMNEALQLNG